MALKSPIIKHVFLMVVSMLLVNTVSGSSEFIEAIKSNDTTAVKKSIETETDVNFVDIDGSTPLLWAIYHENPNILTLLINNGVDINQTNREGITPLILATQTGNSQIVEQLLEAGSDVNQGLANNETPLMMAARTGNLDTLEILLQRGARIDAKENLRGTTALMWAAAYKNPSALKFLLENGASFSLKSATTIPGKEPYIAPTARERIRDYYFETGPNGAQVDVDTSKFEDDEGINVAMSRAELIKYMPKDLVEAFENEQALGLVVPSNRVPRRSSKQWGGLTPLHFAVREGDIESVQILVDAGADVNQVSEFGWTPLLTATQNRNYQIGKYLLSHGANPNISNEGGWNPLYLTTDNRNIEGGDYPTRKPDMSHLEFIRLLLGYGANPNLRMDSSTETRTIFTHQWLKEEGATPFLRASQSSDIELMKLLLEYGADPNLLTEDGVSPLMVASGIAWVEGVTFEWSEEANRETIKLLLELGNDPNAHDYIDERTALMGAGHKGRNYAVEMLVEVGADLAARDIGSRDSMGIRTGITWQAIDYAEGLVRVGVQSAVQNPETAALIRKLMQERGLPVPPSGRTLESVCIVELCE